MFTHEGANSSLDPSPGTRIDITVARMALTTCISIAIRRHPMREGSPYQRKGKDGLFTGEGGNRLRTHPCSVAYGTWSGPGSVRPSRVPQDPKEAGWLRQQVAPAINGDQRGQSGVSGPHHRCVVPDLQLDEPAGDE